MTTKAGMLPGDDFTLAEWSAAQGKPVSVSTEFPAEVKLAYEQLLSACQRTGVPFVAMFSLAGGTATHYDLLDKPENVTEAMLQGRAQASGDIGHQMAMMQLAFGKLDLSKLKGL